MPENNTKATSDASGMSPIVFNGLKETEWRIGVTTSSSEASQLGQTFVQVKMIMETGVPSSSPSSPSSSSPSSSTEQIVQVEMSVPKFYAFLGEMEKVKASLGLFK
ncbi:hypothetical protein BV898_05675 [Hypsibius exemplaris]|uniref:COMM domain-containing protein n=1 Tax=Hypsibius exemplaris TaxID=2072580 RepID=A0A1W0WYW5_HYPEX|nr:hypothetical protein BV898_05675 [Hypsibius exemplaris]